MEALSTEGAGEALQVEVLLPGAKVLLVALATLPASPVPYSGSAGGTASLGGQLLSARPHTSQQLHSRVSLVRHLSMNSFS